MVSLVVLYLFLRQGLERSMSNLLCSQDDPDDSPASASCAGSQGAPLLVHVVLGTEPRAPCMLGKHLLLNHIPSSWILSESVIQCQ